MHWPERKVDHSRLQGSWLAEQEVIPVVQEMQRRFGRTTLAK
jgi:hypothetical protein